MKGYISKNVLQKSANIYTTAEELTVIRVVFPYNQYSIDEIKTISGKYYENKAWFVPLSLKNALQLKEWKYIIKPELKEWANAKHKLKQKPLLTKIKIKGLNGVLRPFQKDGVIFFENQNGRALCGDDMGLGKTIQAIAYCQLHKKRRPIVITCPASLKQNWSNEATKWMKNPTIEILNGKTGRKLQPSDIYIINYDIIANEQTQATDKNGALMFLRNEKPKMIDIPHTGWVDYIKDMNPQILIIDEVHFIKNDTSQRTKGIKRLGNGIPHVLGLSGTLTENGKPIEIYNAVNLIDPSIFPSAWKFKQRYCGAKHNGYGWTFSGASNIKELHKILTSKIMIRRKKSDVLKDLPEKTYSYVPLEIDNRKEYNFAEKDFKDFVRKGVEIKAQKAIESISNDESGLIFEINDIELKILQAEKADKATAIVQIGVLRQLAAKGKLKQIIQWIENFLLSYEKLVVFAVHKFVIAEIMKHFSKVAVKIDGSVPSNKRQNIVDQFQTDKKIRLFVGNIQAAGVGLTLTAASNVAILENPQTPGALEQAIDRLHRIGQLNAVNVWFLQALNTIDSIITESLQAKQNTSDAILDGKDVGSYNLLDEIIKHYKK